MSNRDLRAYIAGFLDGDGCLMAQLVKRSGYIRGYQIRLSIVFYQKKQNKYHLVWLKRYLKHGYVRERNDGMAEYTIVGLRAVKESLVKIYPYLRLKKKLAKIILEIADMPRKLSTKDFLRYCSLADKTAKYTYSKKRTKTVEEVIKYLTKNKILTP